jgi:type I restriction enzyme R subunit
MTAFNESVVEEAALGWLEGLGYARRFGPEIAPGMLAAERDDYGQAVLSQRLRDALARLNPHVPPAALDEAYRKLTRPDRPTLTANNHAAHRMLVEGVPVEYFRPDGSLGGDLVRVLDYEAPDNNDWLAVNQFTVVESGHERRADVVLFVNGLPLAVLELKNAADEKATIWAAFNQLQTYKQQVAGLFTFNEALVISDGVHARIGTLTANRAQVIEDLIAIARELVQTVRNSVTIDWTLRENVRARIRVLVKRILRKYGYPPDKQERATLTVLEQAEVLCAAWAIA